MRVLIVEDDAAVRRIVCEQLESRGVGVVAVGTVAATRTALERENFHAIILDLTLPDGSGLEILAELRASGSTAHVIVLTGAGSEADRVHAIESGADDYVVKPFFARELAARVLAVQRRHGLSDDTMLRVGPLHIDLNARRVTVDDRPLELTAMEFALLAFLAARPGHTFSRGELLKAVWHSSADWQQSSTVTEHVRRLRTKIETDPRTPAMLTTVRGAGYRLDAPTPDTPDQTTPGNQTTHDDQTTHGNQTTHDDRATHGDRATQPTGKGAMTHIDGRIVAADTTAAQILGYADASDLLGRYTLDFAAPGSRAAATERRDLIQQGRSLRSHVVTVQRPDGSEISIEVASSQTTWQGQHARRLEMEISPDPSTRLRRLVTGVHSELSDAVIVTDLHFHVRSWNNAAERLYGWSEHDVLGRHLLDVVDWEDNEFSTATTHLETTGRWHAQGRQRTRDGSRVHVTSSMTMMRDDNNEVIGVVSVNRPITALPDQPNSTEAPDATDVLRGLAAHEFEVHYQPVVTLTNGNLVTVEALVRWQHPDRGLLGPESFLAAAEHSGLIIELDAYVLDTASRQVAAWRTNGADIALSVNVSAGDLADTELADRVINTIDNAGLQPNALWLEVTETSLVSDVDQAAVMLHRLAAHGIGVAIDDFGTGWASLTYLSKFPIHALKIDRVFVAGVNHNPNDRAIVRSIVQLGAELEMAVIAEGIETTAQSEALQALGCTLGQGYLFGEPTPADAVPLHHAHRLSVI